MKRQRRLTGLLPLLGLTGLLMLPLAGCEPREKNLGEEIEDVGEEVGDAVEDATDG